MEAVYSPTSKRYAIKILNKAQLLKHKMTKSATAEKNALAILSSGNHPGVVRLYSAFHDATSLCALFALPLRGPSAEID